MTEITPREYPDTEAEELFVDITNDAYLTELDATGPDNGFHYNDTDDVNVIVLKNTSGQDATLSLLLNQPYTRFGITLPPETFVLPDGESVELRTGDFYTAADNTITIESSQIIKTAAYRYWEPIASTPSIDTTEA